MKPYGKFHIGQTVYSCDAKRNGVIKDILTNEFMPKFIVEYEYDCIKSEPYGNLTIIESEGN